MAGMAVQSHATNTGMRHPLQSTMQ